MIKWLVVALLLAASPALAQNQGQIVPSGRFTTGHTVRCQNSTCTVAVDGGGSAGSNLNGQGYLTELGITNTGTPICINDALINAAGGYHQLCLGANALGGGLISYNAVGGASPLNLNVNVNGQSYVFPPAGNGNVLGPNSSTIGHVVSFNATNGTMVADTSSLTGNALWANVGTFTNTQMNEAVNSLLNSLSPATEFSTVQGGNKATDALTGGVAVPIAATVYQSNAVAGYASASSTTTNTVAGYFQTRALAASTKIWALNTVATDGGFAVTNAGFEADTNCTNAASTCNGITVIGASTAQFTGNGLSISSPSVQSIGTVKWSNGIIISDGCCTAGMIVGASANSGNNVTSQGLFMGYRNGAGSSFDYEFQVNPAQTLAITNNAGSGTANIIVDGTIAISAPHANSPSISFIDVSTTKFQLLRDSGDNFIGFDNANSATFLEVQPSGNMLLGEVGKLVAFEGSLQFSASTTGAVTPAFTNAPTGCTTVQWIGPFQIASPALTNVYLASCHS